MAEKKIIAVLGGASLPLLGSLVDKSLLRADGSELAMAMRAVQPWPEMKPLPMEPPPRWLPGRSRSWPATRSRNC